MQGLVLLLIVGITVWNGVTGYVTLLRKPVRVWRFYVGLSSTLTVIWRTTGLHHLCWEGCIPVARESGDSLADACICCKTPERKDGSPQKVEPGSKEGRGGNPKSLGCPYLQTLPWKDQCWWASPGARKAGERQLPARGVLRCIILLIARHALSLSV